jgi:hypothetical protein
MDGDTEECEALLIMYTKLWSWATKQYVKYLINKIVSYKNLFAMRIELYNEQINYF